MNHVQNIVVVDGKNGNPAKLQTQIEPVRFDQNIGMAITSIAHGEIYNIHNENNKIYVSKVRNAVLHDLDAPAYTVTERFELEIPTGTYKNVFSVIKTIVGITKDAMSLSQNPLNKNERDSLSVSSSNKERITSLAVTDIIIHVEGKIDSPWQFLGVNEDINPSTIIEIENRDFLIGVEVAFLYVNIVENSYINGKKSRNLSLIPMKKQKGCAYHEFANPIYIPIEVKQFSEILLELRNMNGEYVKFNPNSNTVITLHLKPISSKMVE